MIRKAFFGLASLVVLIVVVLAALLFLVTRDLETAPLSDGESSLASASACGAV
jgi:hypothetical protein